MKDESRRMADRFHASIDKFNTPVDSGGVPRPFTGLELAIRNIALEGIETDGGHHKQWYLLVIADLLGQNFADFEFSYFDGIAP